MRFTAVAFAIAASLGAVAQQFSDATIFKVSTNLASSAKQSWEVGTRTQALIELDAPKYSVFTPDSIPPPVSGRDSLSQVASIATAVVSSLSPRPAGSSGPRALFSTPGGAAGDPASVGIAVLLASKTPNDTYARAAADQLQYILHSVPRTPDGAISHRVEQVQLWADFVSMVPPFLAYYGAVTGNASLVREAYTQCALYRKYLRDPSGSGLWRHVALGKGENGGVVDPGRWATGNGWAAAGMLRVLATIQHSSFADQFVNEQDDLEAWTSEILDAALPRVNQTTQLLHNYIDDAKSFSDASGTALLVSTVYRLAVLRKVTPHIPQAETIRTALVDRVNSTGWLSPVTNPMLFSSEGAHSPEGQAFVLLVHAAWKDWVANTSTTSNVATTPAPAPAQSFAQHATTFSGLGTALAAALLIYLGL